MCDSGNGYHLLYKIALENNNENTELITKCLNYLSLRFTDEFLDVDTKVFNASRITKLYGTFARKGANSPERPHRQSKIMQIPSEIKPTPKVLIEKLANLIPEPEKANYHKYYGSNKVQCKTLLIN